MYVLAFNVMIVVFVIIGVYMELPWDVHGTYMYYFCNFHVSYTILTVVTFFLLLGCMAYLYLRGEGCVPMLCCCSIYM